jgi:ubiquinone/menaquinone biosynthesis C-methylase UbiE
VAHSEQRIFFEFAKSLYPEYFRGTTVIEVGSLNINGTIRDFYENCQYLGVDVGEGKDVDLVCGGHELEFPDESFTVAVSAECFEHNPYWKETFFNMHRVASQFVIFTCASEGRPEHGTTRTSPQDSPLTLDWSYYQNLSETDFLSNFDLTKMFREWSFFYNKSSKDLYFWGLK